MAVLHCFIIWQLIRKRFLGGVQIKKAMRD
jgi:hypothetical protein